VILLKIRQRKLTGQIDHTVFNFNAYEGLRRGNHESLFFTLPLLAALLRHCGREKRGCRYHELPIASS